MFRLPGHSLDLLSPFFVHLRHQLASRLADDVPPGAPEEETKKGQPDWVPVLILVLIIFICIIAMLTLLGPTTGVDHSNVIKNL